MVPVHICTDGSTHSPAFVYPLDAPNCRQRGTMWAGMATSRVWDTAEEELLVPIQPLQLQEQRLQVQFLQAPGGWLGNSGSWSMVAFLGGVGWRIWGNVIWLPSRAAVDPLPLILPLLTQSSASPPYPTAVLSPATD